MSLQIDGIDIHVEGEGPGTMVMIHGWPDTWRLWDEQVAFFKQGMRCVRFTLPGFDVDGPRKAWSLDELIGFFRRVVEAVSPGRPVTLMLHDWGCIFGYQFCMRHPELVSHLIGIDIGDAGSKAHVRSLGLKAKLGVIGYQGWLASAWRIGGALGDRMTRSMARALKCRSEPQFIGSCMNYPYYSQWTGRPSSYRGLPGIESACPMLFLYGARKPFMFHSRIWAESLAARPGCAVVALETGHWVMRDRPQAFNEAVAGWLASTHSVTS